MLRDVVTLSTKPLVATISDLFQTENTVQTRMGVEINKIAYSHDEDKDDNCRKLKKSKANVQHGGDGNMNQQ